MDIRGKRAHVIGLGVEGSSLARWFAREGAQVVVHLARPWDVIRADATLSRQVEAMEQLGAAIHAGEDYLKGVVDADVVGHIQSAYTYKYPMNVAVLDEAKRRGIPIVTNLSLFFELCPCPIIGITGTNGKTTTTEMTDAILRAGGLPVHTGGNIGVSPLDEVDSLAPSDIVLLELSNYQLQFVDASPHVGAVTNLAPDHLVDYGGSFERYIAAKKRILDFQRADDWAALNWDDPLLRQWGSQAEGQLFSFNLSHAMEPGAYLHKGKMTVRYQGQTHIVMPAAALAAPSNHNIANALCAIAIGTIHEVDPADMAQALVGYQVGPHRIQTVAQVRGVTWVNDSKSSTPASTVAAIRAYAGQRIILLAGGKDKDLPMDELVAAIRQYVTTVIAFGEWGPALADAAKTSGVSVYIAKGVPQAVEQAAALAKAGDVVLLSPGGTSFDAYTSYAARGDHFIQLVNELEP